MSFCVLHFSVLFWASAVLIRSEQGSVINFIFPSFVERFSQDIELLYGAHVERNGSFNFLQLTQNEGGIPYNEGLATYKNSIPVWDRSSRRLADFNTHFQFVIKPDIANTFGSGEGLTFFMAPLNFKPPESAAGKWLGLFNSTTVRKSSNRVVAVEFDTEKNSHDPDDNHVGIDVNSIVSVANYSVVNESLKDGGKWGLWVDYDGRRKKIQVFLTHNDATKPAVPVLKYGLDLSEIVPPDVKIGFSAATGMGFETHTLLFWDFIAQLHGTLRASRSRVRTPSTRER